MKASVAGHADVVDFLLDAGEYTLLYINTKAQGHLLSCIFLPFHSLMLREIRTDAINLPIETFIIDFS